MFSETNEQAPWWTPDGQTVYYISGAGRDVWSTLADGTGEPELLLDDERDFQGGEWSSDREWLVLRSRASSGDPDEPDLDILALHLGVDSVAIPLVATAEFAETHPMLSPDGRWLAYSSNETGTHEVWVRPFPDVEASETQVSVNGGTRPRWAHSGRELFYVGENREFVAAQIDTVSGFRVVGQDTLFTVPQDLLLGGSAAPYDVAPDDQRFLMARTLFAAASSTEDHVLVLNFFEELKELLGN